MPYIYFFKDDIVDKALLGNKGANLVTMTKLGLPIPPGFILSIKAYKEYERNGSLPAREIEEALSLLEKENKDKFGRDLSVSVRSSAPVSMPGMMDTVLNLRNQTEVMSTVKRIFNSWDNLRAIEYRRLHHIPSNLGTAAIVQAMVFGNQDENSGTGVVFTRNPATGEKRFFGEYIPQAQGEAIVSGKTTPEPIETLKSGMPEVYTQLEEIADTLEKHFRDMQDIEFTVESGKLYILQTRAGKRSGQAAIRIAVDMVGESLLSPQEAILRVTPQDLRTLLFTRIKSPQKHQPITQGLNASPGAASGKVVFHPEEAVIRAKMNEKIILVRPETNPDDIQGINAAHGVLTSRGGLTSHAAIVTRAMGKPCVCGAEAIVIDLKKERFQVDQLIIRKEDEITIDGNTGNVYSGSLTLEKAEPPMELAKLLSWTDEYRRLGVKANADTAEMIIQAKEFGAEGIGLCRTERLFNAPERLSIIREFILAETKAERLAAIKHLQKLQKEDFVALFQVLDGMPIVIRLLDVPLHEFLPKPEQAEDPQLRQRIKELEEVNPMLGHRGVRLGVTFPEIYEMQINTIIEAMKEIDADVSIMIPQVITLQEFLWVKRLLKGAKVKLGVMMETVRACMRAGKLAQEADFLSFGTNDLTQAVFSFSREDAERKFLTAYLQVGILNDNPFEIIDVKGVGRLMETAIFWAKKGKPDIEIGVCGEHAGEPRSIEFFHQIGIDYISCSPFRIPVAKLVAAQAALEGKPTSELVGSS